MQQGFFSVQQTCPSCNGSGTKIEEYCSTCNGTGLTQSTKKLSVTIPAGVDHGDKVRLSGEGNAISGGQNGDLYVVINVLPNKIFLSPIFKKKRNNQLGIFRYLSLRKLSSMKDVALGGINNKNIKKFYLIKPFGFAGISYFT